MFSSNGSQTDWPTAEMTTYEPRLLTSARGIVLVIDTHFIDDPSHAAVELRRLHGQGPQIALARTDVIDTELLGVPPEKSELATRAAEYPEVLGLWVLGHSRLGSTNLGSDEDAARHARVFEIVYPVVDDRSEARDQHHRDAMNVSAGIKWKTSAFVTRNKRLLNKDDALRTSSRGFGC